jgi:hypothetical protein
MARQKKKDKRFQIKPVRCKRHDIELPKNRHCQREFYRAIVRGVIAIEAYRLLSQLTALLIIQMERAKRLPKAAPHCCAAT